MPTYNLGTARGRITLDASGAVKGAAQAEGAAKSATTKMAGAGRGAVLAGGALTGVAAGVGAAFALAVGSAASFEKQISAIGAVSGANGKQLEDLRGKALQLGKDTKFSASEAASAIEELVKAGVSVPDVLNGAADATVALAAAGEIDLPQAATIASNAMNAFALNAAALPKVADLIAGAANASAIDVTQFGQSLQQVGAVAHLSGLSFDDTAVAIAEMGNAGIKGSDAGTSLKTMLQNLIPVTDKQIALSKKMGLITKDGSNAFFDQHGKIKSLAQIQGVLQKATQGMSKEQKLAAFNTLFGSDSIRAAAVFAEQGAGGYNKLAGSMKKVTAEGVAQERMNNLAGQWEQLKGSLETVGITIGTMLLPAVRKLVEFGTKALNWFLNLNPGVQKAIVLFIAITAAVLGFVGIVVTIAGAIAIAMAALAPLAAVLGIGAGALLGWIAIIPILIAIIVALVIVVVKNWTTIKNFTVGVWNAIAGFFISVWNKIYAFFATVLGAIAKVVTTYVNIWKTIITTIFRAIVAVISFYINVWLTIIRTVLAIIMAVWSAFWNTFGGLIKAVLGFIVALIRLQFAIMVGIILLTLQAIRTAFVTIWNIIVAVVRFAIGLIVAVVKTEIAIMKAIITGVLSALQFLWSSFWNGLVLVAKAIWGVIGGTVKTGVRAVFNFIARLASLGKTVGGYFAGIVTNAATQIGKLITLVAGIGGRVLTALGDMAKLLFDAGAKIIQGLIDGITSMFGKLTGVVDKATGLVKKFLPGSPVEEGPLRVLNNGYAGKQIMGMIIDGIASRSGELASTFYDAVNGITTTINPAVSADTTASFPGITVAAPPPSATPQSPVPKKMVLRIGDRDFEAYVQEINDDADRGSSQQIVAGRRG